MKTIYVFALIFICYTAHAQRTIELRKHVSEKQNVNLSDIAKSVRYIQLETRDDCILSNELQIVYTPDFIFIGDQQSQKFYRFDRRGKYLNTIGRKGEGPAEYPTALFFYVDETTKTVALTSHQTQSIYVYDYDGAFQSKIKFPETPWTINKLGKNYISYNPRYNRIKGSKKPKELFLINSFGEIINSLPTTVKDEKNDMLLMELPFFYSYNQQLFYKNQVHDDVFQIESDLKLKSVYKINTGKQEIRKDYYKDLKRLGGNHISIRNIFENDNILLITYAYEHEFHYLLVEKHTWTEQRVGGSISGFTDDINNGPLFKPYWMAETAMNVLVSVLPIGEKEEQPEAFQNTTNIDSSISNMKVDDNPILIIAELK